MMKNVIACLFMLFSTAIFPADSHLIFSSGSGSSSGGSELSVHVGLSDPSSIGFAANDRRIYLQKKAEEEKKLCESIRRREEREMAERRPTRRITREEDAAEKSRVAKIKGQIKHIKQIKLLCERRERQYGREKAIKVAHLYKQQVIKARAEVSAFYEKNTRPSRYFKDGGSIYRETLGNYCEKFESACGRVLACYQDIEVLLFQLNDAIKAGLSAGVELVGMHLERVREVYADLEKAITKLKNEESHIKAYESDIYQNIREFQAEIDVANTMRKQVRQERRKSLTVKSRFKGSGAGPDHEDRRREDDASSVSSSDSEREDDNSSVSSSEISDLFLPSDDESESDDEESLQKKEKAEKAKKEEEEKKKKAVASAADNLKKLNGLRKGRRKRVMPTESSHTYDSSEEEEDWRDDPVEMECYREFQAAKARFEKIRAEHERRAYVSEMLRRDLNTYEAGEYDEELDERFSLFQSSLYSKGMLSYAVEYALWIHPDRRSYLQNKLLALSPRTREQILDVFRERKRRAEAAKRRQQELEVRIAQEHANAALMLMCYKPVEEMTWEEKSSLQQFGQQYPDLALQVNAAYNEKMKARQQAEQEAEKARKKAEEVARKKTEKLERTHEFFRKVDEKIARLRAADKKRQKARAEREKLAVCEVEQQQSINQITYEANQRENILDGHLMCGLFAAYNGEAMLDRAHGRRGGRVNIRQLKRAELFNRWALEANGPVVADLQRRGIGNITGDHVERLLPDGDFYRDNSTVVELDTLYQSFIPVRGKQTFVPVDDHILDVIRSYRRTHAPHLVILNTGDHWISMVVSPGKCVVADSLGIDRSYDPSVRFVYDLFTNEKIPLQRTIARLRVSHRDHHPAAAPQSARYKASSRKKRSRREMTRYSSPRPSSGAISPYHKRGRFSASQTSGRKPMLRRSPRLRKKRGRSGGNGSGEKVERADDVDMGQLECTASFNPSDDLLGFEGFKATAPRAIDFNNAVNTLKRRSAHLAGQQSKAPQQGILKEMLDVTVTNATDLYQEGNYKGAAAVGSIGEALDVLSQRTAHCLYSLGKGLVAGSARGGKDAQHTAEHVMTNPAGYALDTAVLAGRAVDELATCLYRVTTRFLKFEYLCYTQPEEAMRQAIVFKGCVERGLRRLARTYTLEQLCESAGELVGHSMVSGTAHLVFKHQPLHAVLDAIKGVRQAAQNFPIITGKGKVIKDLVKKHGRAVAQRTVEVISGDYTVLEEYGSIDKVAQYVKTQVEAGAKAVKKVVKRARRRTRKRVVENELANLDDVLVRPAGRGVSKGRRTPRNLREKLAMKEVMSNPGDCKKIDLTKGMTDSRWPAKEGWIKLRQRVRGVNIHYVKNTKTGQYDDFKFKDNLTK